MKPYGITLKDRRRMYDYGADKFNSRGCFDACSCNICRNKKAKIRKNTVRKKASESTNNIMRMAKKRARQIAKKGLRYIITND